MVDRSDTRRAIEYQLSKTPKEIATVRVSFLVTSGKEAASIELASKSGTASSKLNDLTIIEFNAADAVRTMSMPIHQLEGFGDVSAM